MITHSINAFDEGPVPVPHRAQKSKKFQGQYNSREHQAFILQRAVDHNPFIQGEFVKYRGNVYQITDILTDMAEPVEWTGLKPRFIELWGNSNQFLVHPGDIKKARK